MKAVITGIDFVETSSGDVKLLEINTNIALVLPYTSFFDFDGLMTFCNDNLLTKIVFIYTEANAGKNFKETLTTKCSENNITLTLTSVPFNSITVPNVEDAEDTLILRHAYDVTAIIDDTYSRDKHELTKLFIESSNQESVVPTYINSVIGEYNNLENSPNISQYPDFIVKKRYPDLVKDVYPKFFKTSSESDISELKTTYSGDYVLQNFVVDSNNITTSGKLTFIRSFVMFYGGTLSQLNLGSYRFSNLAPVSSELSYTNGSTIEVSNDSKMEFTNNANPQSMPGFPQGVMVQKLNESTNEFEPIDIANIQIGDTLKTVELAGIVSEEPFGWSNSGATLPFATTYDTSIVSAKYETPMADFLVLVHFSESTSIRMGINQTLIVYDSETDTTSFKFAKDLKITDQAFVDVNNTLDDIIGIEYVYFTGNVYDVTLATDHIFLTYLEGSTVPSTYVSLLTHNRPKQPKA
jgi:hypothetical protein